jgi:hypothetical protein
MYPVVAVVSAMCFEDKLKLCAVWQPDPTHLQPFHSITEANCHRSSINTNRATYMLVVFRLGAPIDGLRGSASAYPVIGQGANPRARANRPEQSLTQFRSAPTRQQPFISSYFNMRWSVPAGSMSVTLCKTRPDSGLTRDNARGETSCTLRVLHRQAQPRTW